MVLRVKLLGSGTDGDPYRVNLPSYSLVQGLIADGIGYVTVSPQTLGLTDDDLKEETAHPTTEGPLYMDLSATNKEKVKKHLDDAYPDKAHDVEFVLG